ncbi:MAG: serine/threonine protein kinase [Colwellia sp.]|nr:serine/threonine protein kinase [Colwellia sp.]
MKSSAQIAKSYEKWCVNYLKRTGESISLIQSQVLKSFWYEMNSAEISVEDEEYIRDYSEGVRLFKKLISSIYKESKLSHSYTSLADFFVNYVDKQILINIEKNLTFIRFIKNFNKKEKNDKNIADSIINYIINKAKGDEKLGAINISHTTDLTFLNLYMNNAKVKLKSSIKEAKKLDPMIKDELLFEVQIRQIVHHFIKDSSLNTLPVLPSELSFNHLREFNKTQKEFIELSLRDVFFSLLKVNTYHDLLKGDKFSFVDQEIKEKLNSSSKEQPPYTEMLASCWQNIPSEITSSSYCKPMLEHELKALIKLQLYISLAIDVDSIVNTNAIAQRALYISSLLNLLEYTKDKVGHKIFVDKIKYNFERMKANCIKVAKIWILYLIDRKEFDGIESSLEDWVVQRYNYFLRKDQLIFRLSELQNQWGQYNNLRRDPNIANEVILLSLSTKGKNNDFCSWLDAHHISSLDSIKEVELASKAIYKSKDFSVFNRLFFERIFVNNVDYLGYQWGDIFCGNDKELFIVETIIESLKSFSNNISTKAGNEMTRSHWNKILTKSGGVSEQVFKRFSSVFSKSIDPDERDLVISNRNKFFKSINFNKRINNRYQFISDLGVGGNGFVLKATDDNLYREVAIKLNAICEFTHPEAFKREARILAGFKHENIIQVYDFINVDSSIFEGHNSSEVYGIVSEYYCGAKTLDQYIKNNTLSHDRKIELFQKICSGISAVHQQNVIHSDIKPENIIVTKEGIPKIIDFGSSCFENIPTQNSASIKWMSPNILKGNKPTKADDIYSLTLVLLFIFDLDFSYLAKSKQSKIKFIRSDKTSAEESFFEELDCISEQGDIPEFSNFDDINAYYTSNQSVLFELLLTSCILFEKKWYWDRNNWALDLCSDDGSEPCQDYFCCDLVNNNHSVKFVEQLNKKIFFSHANEKRLSSFFNIILKGLSSANKPISMRKNSSLNQVEFLKVAMDSNLIQESMKPFSSVEQLNKACCLLNDISANSNQQTFTLINQALLNGQVISKSIIDELPEIRDYDDESIVEVKCKFSSFDMNFDIADSLVLLNTGDIARLWFMFDGNHDDKALKHPVLSQYEKAPLVNILL